MTVLKNCEIKNEEYKIEIYIEVYTWHVFSIEWTFLIVNLNVSYVLG